MWDVVLHGFSRGIEWLGLILSILQKFIPKICQKRKLAHKIGDSYGFAAVLLVKASNAPLWIKYPQQTIFIEIKNVPLKCNIGEKFLCLVSLLFVAVYLTEHYVDRSTQSTNPTNENYV